MPHLYQDDSLTLHTDLYQINMMQTYFELGRHQRQAVFEVFSVRCPLKMVMLFLLV
jgi:nicotinate phosphoribosyltransferase